MVSIGLLPVCSAMSTWLSRIGWIWGSLSLSIQLAVTGVCAGVMDSVSGLREISWREGVMTIFSEGLAASRSRKPMQTVESARRRLEDTRRVERAGMRAKRAQRRS